MFEHSIKVPRLYKSACKILKEVTEGKGSVKQLVYDAKHPNVKAIYALVVETIQRHAIIENLLRKSKFTEKEPRFDPVLARILITELLWGKKRLTGESKPVKLILGYEQIFRAHLSDVEDIPKPLMQGRVWVTISAPHLGREIKGKCSGKSIKPILDLRKKSLKKATTQWPKRQDSTIYNAVHNPETIFLQPINSPYTCKCVHVSMPRYVRINTLKMSTNKAVDAFRDEGWVLCRRSPDYSAYLSQISSLNDGEFAVDFHLDNMLVFPPRTQFHKHPAYIYKQIILQDKASCLSAHILQPEPGSTVLDMCAAPGMKTTQLAAQLRNKGTIYAVELCINRFAVLNKMVQNAGATCVKTINKDVLTLSGKELSGVEYILVDPSCSGSGMVKRLELDQSDTSKDINRLAKLAGFQIKILRHALTRFPQAKRVVYSTCSIHPEENEDVVRQVLETCSTFKLVPAQKHVKDAWPNCGSSDFGGIGEMCLYARPEIDCTNGFFVAVFERLEEDETNPFFNKDLFKWQKKMDKRVQQDETSANDSDEADLPESKHRRRKSESDDSKCLQTQKIVVDGNEAPIVSEKNYTESTDLLDTNAPNSNSSGSSSAKKKRRKRHKENKANDSFSSLEDCESGEKHGEAIATNSEEADLPKSTRKRRKSKPTDVECLETKVQSTSGLADSTHEAPDMSRDNLREKCSEYSDLLDTNMPDFNPSDSSSSKRKKKKEHKEPNDGECSETEVDGTKNFDSRNEALNTNEESDNCSAKKRNKKRHKERNDIGCSETGVESPTKYEQNRAESSNLVNGSVSDINSTDTYSRKKKKKIRQENENNDSFPYLTYESGEMSHQNLETFNTSEEKQRKRKKSKEVVETRVENNIADETKVPESVDQTSSKRKRKRSSAIDASETNIVENPSELTLDYSNCEVILKNKRRKRGMNDIEYQNGHCDTATSQVRGSSRSPSKNKIKKVTSDIDEKHKYYVNELIAIGNSIIEDSHSASKENDALVS